jgi:sugar lactone lactonase YvrE
MIAVSSLRAFNLRKKVPVQRILISSRIFPLLVLLSGCSDRPLDLPEPVDQWGIDLGSTDAAVSDGGGQDAAGDASEDAASDVDFQVLSLLAGSTGGRGAFDDIGTAARFNQPYAVAVDGSGNLFVADTFNSTIRKMTPSGVVSTFAGQPGERGGADGASAEARFFYPFGIAIDRAGNLFVTDSDGHIIRKITPSGVVSTFAGKLNVSGTSDGTGSDARFFRPQGVAVDGADNLFIADTANASIRKITPDGIVSTFAGLSGQFGREDGTGDTARFEAPQGIAIGGVGNLFVVDNQNIRKITPNAVVSTFAGQAGLPGILDGTGPDARFNFPEGIAVDGAGNLFVADTSNSIIRKITPNAVVSTFAGETGDGSRDGTGASARFHFPFGVAVDSSGTFFVADTLNHTIRKVTPSGVVSTFAGQANKPGDSDGTGPDARFNLPIGVAIDASDNLFVADTGNYAIRKITPSGVVSTFAGKPGRPGPLTPGDTGDGTGEAARFDSPAGIAIDGAGNLFVADVSMIKDHIKWRRLHLRRKGSAIWQCRWRLL